MYCLFLAPVIFDKGNNEQQMKSEKIPLYKKAWIWEKLQTGVSLREAEGERCLAKHTQIHPLPEALAWPVSREGQWHALHSRALPHLCLSLAHASATTSGSLYGVSMSSSLIGFTHSTNYFTKRRLKAPNGPFKQAGNAVVQRYSRERREKSWVQTVYVFF